MKYCPKCKQDFPTTDFNKNKARTDGLASTCRQCNSDYKKQHYAANSDKVKASVKERKQEIRDKFWDYKKYLPCTDCRLVDPIVLEFDHLHSKVDNIATMVSDGAGWDTILAEIAKCEPVCANCHRRRTHNRRCAVLV